MLKYITIHVKYFKFAFGNRNQNIRGGAIFHILQIYPYKIYIEYGLSYFTKYIIVKYKWI